MVHVVALQELGELIRYEERTVISVDKASQPVLGDDLLQAQGQQMSGLGCDFVEEEVLAEEIGKGQVLFSLVGEVVGCNLLPWAIMDIPGKYGLCMGRGFVLGADSTLADVINYICINAGPIHCLSCLCLHLIYH